MAHGPGKYDRHATIARLATGASAVILIVLDGDQGNGFAVQAIDPLLTPAMIVAILRQTADTIATQANAKSD